MTSRERLEAAFRCREVDRIPVSPQGFGRVGPDSELGRSLLKETDVHVYTGGGLDWFGKDVRVESLDEGDLSITIWHTSAGEFRAVSRTTERTSARVEFPCRTPQDGERFLKVPFGLDRERIARAAEEFHRRRAEIGEDGMALAGIPDGICLPAELFSPEDFCLLWVDAPDMMESLVREGHRRVMQGVRALLERGVDAFRIIGPEYASTQLGPDAYERLVVPYDRELVALIKGAGAIAYLHNHGPIMRYLPMIREIAPNALDPVEAPPWGDFVPERARELLGEEVCIVGNLDDMEVLDKRPFEDIWAAAERLMQALGKRGLVLSGTASGIYGVQAAENFLMLARKVGRLG